MTGEHNMAIVIPSKNIYDLSNPKVRDNVYKRVEVNAQKGVADNQFDVNVANFSVETEEYTASLNSSEWTENSAYEYRSLAYNDGYRLGIAVVGVRGHHIARTFRIKEELENSYISKLKSLLEDGTGQAEGINVSLQCIKYDGHGNALYDRAEGKVIEKSITYSDPSTYNSLVKVSFNDGLVESMGTVPAVDVVQSEILFTTSVTIADNYDILPVFTKTDYGWLVEIDMLLCCLEKYTGNVTDMKRHNSSATPAKQYNIDITAEKYEPIYMEIFFQGNTIGIDFEKETISIGEQNSKNALSIDENELIQNTNIYHPPFKHYYDSSHEVIELQQIYSQRVKVQYILNGTRGEKYIAGNKSLRIYNPTPVPFEVVSVTFVSNGISEFYKHILDEYNKGKETATLTCTMSEYKNTDGETVINANNYNLTDLNYFSSSSFNFNSVDNSAILTISQKAFDMQFNCYINGVADVLNESNGRYNVKSRFTNNSNIKIEVQSTNLNGEIQYHSFNIDTSYLPSGSYSLSFEIDVKITTITFFNLQINSGKPRMYQKPCRMHFVEGDIVIPMKYTSSGTDVGISLYNNNVNTPKQFKVTGVEFFYDGVTRQKLTLQEV
jgi:hypothetical protein